MLGALLWLSHGPLSFLVSLCISAWKREGNEHSTFRLRRLDESQNAYSNCDDCDDSNIENEHEHFQDGYRNCDDTKCNNAYNDCCTRWKNEPPSCSDGFVPMILADECTTNQTKNYHCCESEPIEENFFDANLIRLCLLAIWIALTLFTGVAVAAKLKNQQQFPDAVLLPEHLQMGPDREFAYGIFDFFSDRGVCCYVIWCDPVSNAENHTLLGTATFWQIFCWFEFTHIVSQLIAAAAQLEFRLDIESFIRGLLLSLVMTRRRQALRGRLGQAEEARKKAWWSDFMTWWFCFCCAGIQEFRHVHAVLPYKTSVGPTAYFQNQTMMPPTVVGAPVSVVGQPITTNEEVGSSTVTVVGMPVAQNYVNRNANH